MVPYPVMIGCNTEPHDSNVHIQRHFYISKECKNTKTPYIGRGTDRGGEVVNMTIRGVAFYSPFHVCKVVSNKYFLPL